MMLEYKTEQVSDYNQDDPNQEKIESVPKGPELHHLEFCLVLLSRLGSLAWFLNVSSLLVFREE